MFSENQRRVFSHDWALLQAGSPQPTHSLLEPSFSHPLGTVPFHTPRWELPVSFSLASLAWPCSPCSSISPHLDGLGYVHFVYLDLGKAAPRHILVFFLVAIKEVGGIYSNTNCSLRNDERNKYLALTTTQHRPNQPWLWVNFLLFFFLVLHFSTLKCVSSIFRTNKMNNYNTLNQQYKSWNKLDRRQFSSRNAAGNTSR